MAKQKYILGFLVLVMLTASIYIMIPGAVRIDIEKTKSTFKVWENESWVVSGVEYVNLFDGSAKMRASERTIENTMFENTSIITRTAQYKNNILVVERYIFDGSTEDVTLFPVEHSIDVIGADRPDRPYILQYEVQKLLYTGETIGPIEAPQSFGHKMRVEWEDGNYYSRIFKYSGRDEGKLTIKYRIDSDRFSKNVRLFDPPENITVILNSPDDDEVIFNNPVTFNGTANITGAELLVNMSLWTNETGTWTQYNITNMIGTLVYDNYDANLLASLKSYYAMNESSGPTVDSLTGSNDGTSSGVTFEVEGVNEDKAYFFDGENDYVAGVVGTEITDFRSVSLWFKTTNSTTGTLWGSDRSGVQARTISLVSGTNIQYNRFPAADSSVALSSRYDDGEWHNVVVTDGLDGRDIVWFDGIAVINLSQSSYNAQAGMTMGIGARWNFGGSFNGHLNSTIDEFAVWTATLNASQVLQLNQTGVITEATSSWNRTISGSTLWNIQACDTNGDCNFADLNRTVLFDNQSPIIEIIFPQSINYTTPVVSLNYTASDLSGDSCWYSLDGGETNSSSSSFGVNFTGLLAHNGLNNWTVYCNDTGGLENSSIVFFNTTEFVNMSIELNFSNAEAELGGDVLVNATSNIGIVYVDIDHPDYGINYSSGFLNTNFELIINYFQKNIFNDSSVSKVLEFVGTQIKDIFFPAHQYDEVDNMSINISGISTAQYPENVQINKSNTTEVDRIFPGYLTGPLIYLNKLNTGSTNSTLFFSSLSPQSIEFFMDDGAKFNNFTFNITGSKFGFSYLDNFNDSSVLDSVLNGGMFRGGFALPGGTDLTSFIYDSFTPAGTINSSLWTPSANGDFDQGNPDDQYTWTINNSYNGGLVLSVTMFEDVSSANTATNIINNSAYVNFTKLNIWTTQELDFIVEHTSSAIRDGSRRTCSIVPQLHLGNIKLWEAPWQICDDSLPSNCNVASGTITPLSFHMERAINNSWNISISGVERTFGDDIEEGDCGSYNFIYNYTNGSLSKTYQTPGGACSVNNTVVALDNFTTVENLNWNTVEQLKSNIALTATYDDDDNEGCDVMSSVMNMSVLNHSLYNLTNSSIISDSVFTSSGDITDATLNLSACVDCASQAPGSAIFPFMSADNGDNYESVTQGVEHSFSFPGTDMKYKYDFNLSEVGYITNTPFLFNMSIETPEGFPTNLTFDFGDDGIIDASFSGELNSSNSPATITIISPDLSSAFTGFTTFDHLFEIPLKVTSANVGELFLDDFNLTYNPNPIVLNSTSILAYLVNLINFVDFPISIESTGGNITVDDVKYNYAGGNDTINVLAHNVDYSQNVSRNITYYYSRWDYDWIPAGVEWIYFAPGNPTSVNVTPYGQTPTTPILNVTNYGYGGKNTVLSIYENDSLSCVDTFMSSNNTKPLASLWDGLVSYWSFDIDARDIIGGNDGIINGATHNDTGGQLGGAYEFDGTGDVIEDADAEDYLNGMTVVSVTFWIKSDVTNTDNGVFTATTPDGGDDGFAFRYDAGGASGGEPNVTKVAVGSSIIESSASVQTTDWQHIVITASAGEVLKLYINGTLDTPSWTTGTFTSLNGLNRLLIGLGTKGTIGSSGWNGTIDEFKIYNRTLNSSEISELYNRSFNKYYDVKLQEDWQVINSDIPYLNATDIYLWADYNCTFDTWHLFEPQYYFRQCVDGGICSTDLI